MCDVTACRALPVRSEFFQQPVISGRAMSREMNEAGRELSGTRIAGEQR